ncbi:MAG: PAS domain S-box protein [Acetivibrionales bacterium]|jgi:PAS domain S-box-containing protein
MKKAIALLLMINMFLSGLVTAYAHLNTEIDFYELFEQQGSIMLIIDPQTGEIKHANKAASDFYGYSEYQLESMTINDINILSPDEVEKEMQAALTEQRDHFIFRHRLANGDIRTVEVYSCPHTSGDITVLFSTVYDITEKTQLAEKNKILVITLIVVLTSVIASFGIFTVLLNNNKKRLERSNSLLMESESSLRLLLDSTAEAIYGIDIEGNCTFCNKSCLKLLGYEKQEELTGKNMHRLIHHKHSDGTEFPIDDCKIYKAFISGEGIHVDDEVLWRADGTCFPVEYFSYPQLRDGKIVGAVVTFIDITERIQAQNEIKKYNEKLENANKLLQEKQYSLEEQNAIIEELNSQLEDDNERIQQQKEVLQAIIDSFGAGIIMVDTEGHISFINEAWKEIFNYLDISEGLDNKFYISNNTGYDTEAFLQNMMTGIENGSEVVLKLTELTRDKESRFSVDLEQTKPVKRFLNLYSNPCISHKNHNFGRVYVIRDISHQKEVERLKLELINTVSHELRTPMSSVLGFSELLLTRKLSEERSVEYIRTINTEARRLTNLINDFLDMQRMESGKQVFSKTFNSIDDIIENAIRLFDSEDNKYRIIYNRDMDSLPRIYCDRDKILQVMTNIISNAIKYSPDGGEINIILTGDSERIKVSIKDQGLGIPENEIDKLFNRFYRIDSDDRRNIGGTGLGLAICKEIIKAHGGEIGVDSIYGKGSTFYFILPRSDGIVTGENEMDTISKDNMSITLIAEDDASMAGHFNGTLSRDKSLAEGIADILSRKGIGVKHVEFSGNLLIITLKGDNKLGN